MKCPLCKTEMKKGSIDLTFRRDRGVVVIESVPAMVCGQCGEASLSETVSKAAYDLGDKQLKQNALEFCKFEAA